MPSASAQSSDRRALRAAWDAHSNRGGPSSLLLAIHDGFRTAADRVLLALEQTSNPGWAGRVFAPLAMTLHAHHHAEEVSLFPLVETRTGVRPEQLEADHRTLTRAIDAAEAALVPDADVEQARAAASAFRDILVEHLDREEELVIPVLLEMSPDAAWRQIHGEAE